MVEEEKQPTILPGNLFRRTESTEKRIRPEVEARKVDVVAEKRRKQNKWDMHLSATAQKTSFMPTRFAHY